MSCSDCSKVALRVDFLNQDRSEGLLGLVILTSLLGIPVPDHPESTCAFAGI